uniref:Ectonucleotide pyrophosphatase/phosphodiesterase 1 n=1 Tax=Scleropages formosus TaxID=113540 RepID=A0A8C9R878_SCLFO
MSFIFSSFSKSPVILVSMDGFRAGYLDVHKDHLPVISKLRNCGTSPPYMRPTYPTKTFPNHYTIVTGLYPESHGIVDNKMYDVKQNAFFTLRTEEKFNPKWYLGQPVWLTAMYNNLKSGTFFWPGTDVNISGSYPNRWMPYNWNVAFETRIETILEWLDLPPKERPDFYTLYLEEPDTSGHRYGPVSSQVVNALKRVDSQIGLLMDGLKERNLDKCVNLVLVSDHGMEEASCEKSVFISQLQKHVENFFVTSGAASRIRPTKLPEDFFTFDYEGLVKNLSCRTPNLKPYLKEHLPKRMHFANNVRIERGHLYMKEQWQAAIVQDMKYCTGGFHGSDNVFKNMQGIFIAHGPGLKSRTTVPPFENIEVYNLLCDLLGIPPAPNNGTHGSLNHLLKVPFHRPVYPAERSPASACEAGGNPSKDDLGCTCSSVSKEEVGSQQMVSARKGLQIGSQTQRMSLFQGYQVVWTYFHDALLMKYSKNMNGVNVMSGPVFDQNFDGIYDTMDTQKSCASLYFRHQIQVPTHFYVILTSCSNSSFSPENCEDPLQSVAFILPHRPDNIESAPNFEWVQEWAQFHVARVRDIELLTGLSFYHERISVEETLQLKTFLKIF